MTEAEILDILETLKANYKKAIVARSVGHGSESWSAQELDMMEKSIVFWEHELATIRRDGRLQVQLVRRPR